MFEDQFHPLGGVADELYLSFVDWLGMNLIDQPLSEGTDRRRFVRRNGKVIEGTARPPWMDVETVQSR